MIVMVKKDGWIEGKRGITTDAMRGGGVSGAEPQFKLPKATG